MKLKTAKGEKEYKIKDLDFTNVMCDLEDKGVDIMAIMNDGDVGGKAFSTVRTITAALIGETDLKKVGRILTEHLSNGGDFSAVLDAFSEMMANAGFGKAATEDTPTAAAAE